MAKGFSLDDYVDVGERIQDFMDAHPKGRLQRVEWEVREVGGITFVVYTARAYPDKAADPEDYGEGTAWEPFPGTTPYTKNSELMNAETAAWGRAIIALGLVANRKLASRQEVRARKEEQDAARESENPDRKPDAEPTPQAPAPDDELLGKIRNAYKVSGKTNEWLAWTLQAVGVDLEDVTEAAVAKAMGSLTLDQASQILEALGASLEDDVRPDAAA